MDTSKDVSLCEEKAPLMVTISGIRGIWGQSLTTIVCSRYVRAFAKTMKLKGAKTGAEIVVGSDTRESRVEICRTACGVLEDEGFKVHYCGIVPTPTVQFGVIHTKACAGLIVTSSHNPRGWNGLKFVDADGLFLSPADCKTLFDIAETLPKLVVESELEYDLPEPDPSVANAHVKKVLNIGLTTPRIHSLKDMPKLRVALDTINGAGGVLLPNILKQMGCEVVHINSSLDGVFAREPEPTPSNLKDFGAFMRSDGRFDIGLVCDPDADRLALLDETGAPLCEELTLSIAVDMILNRADTVCIRTLIEAANKDVLVSNRTGKVEIVKNLSSSRNTDDVIAHYNATRAKKDGLPQAHLSITPVGEVNVAREMQRIGAIIGGEGNGGVMMTQCHIGRDSLVGSYLVLLWLADNLLEAGKHVALSSLASSIHRWHIYKDKASMDIEKSKITIGALAKHGRTLKGVQTSLIDGVKLDTTDWWIHARASNTEPVIRIVAEARSPEEAQSLVKEWIEKLHSLANKAE